MISTLLSGKKLVNFIKVHKCPVKDGISIRILLIYNILNRVKNSCDLNFYFRSYRFLSDRAFIKNSFCAIAEVYSGSGVLKMCCPFTLQTKG